MIARISGILVLWISILACQSENQVPDDGVIHPSVKKDEVYILVHARYDGGTWWFPQPANYDDEGNLRQFCNSEGQHQGKPLFDSLQQWGYTVDETCQGEQIELRDYSQLSLIMMGGFFHKVDSLDTRQIEAFVSDGGNLLIMATRPSINLLAQAFDLSFAEPIGPIWPNRVNILDNPLTAGVSDYSRSWNNTIALATGYDRQITPFVRFDPDYYIDANENRQLDDGEITAPVFIGALEYGKGRILFSGDINFWQLNPQVFKNAIAWFEI